MQKIFIILKMLSILAVMGLLVNACGSDLPPVIDKIVVGSEPVTASSTAKFICLASDRNGEALSYTWSASQGAIEGQSPIALWQAPSEPGTYTISVMVQNINGKQTSSQISVDVLDMTAPVIDSLIAEPSVVGQGKEAVITCKAYDPQGDELIYNWEAIEGQITGDGPVVTWLAQTNQNTCVLEIEVVDQSGNSTTKSVIINVLPNHIPVLKSLTASPQKVVGGKTSTITCQATDVDGDMLQYKWKATAGEFTGSGNIIVWTAPTDCQQATVSVEVSDGRGEQVSKSVTITVAKEGG